MSNFNDIQKRTIEIPWGASDSIQLAYGRLFIKASEAVQNLEKQGYNYEEIVFEWLPIEEIRTSAGSAYKLKCQVRTLTRRELIIQAFSRGEVATA